MRQIKQLRKGLKETMLGPLLRQRPDVLPVIIPCEINVVDLGDMQWRLVKKC